MKIAMIGQKTVPSRDGGIEVAVGELAVRMKKNGHQPELYNRWTPGEPGIKGTYQGMRIYRVPTCQHSSLNALVYSVLATARAVFGGYDVIHIHAEGPAAMAWLPRLLGIPVVVTIHGLDWKRSKWGRLASAYLRLGERMAVRFADGMIVLSEPAADYFEQVYGRKTHLIRNGVTMGIRRGPDEIRRRWGLEENGYVLFLSRLTPEKGLHYLLRAFKEVKTERRLVIAGRISDHPYTQRISRMAGEDPRVLMVDFAEGALLEELFSNCCLYAFPSDIEGMALSLLEALSFGAPCLASDIPENRGIADPYIQYFKRGDVADLRRQLEQCLSQPFSRERRDGQITYIQTHYDWDRITDETLSYYHSVRERKREARRRKRGKTQCKEDLQQNI